MYRLLEIIWYVESLLAVFGGREASSKWSQSVLCIVQDGTTHRLAVFALYEVLLEPASATWGQNRGSTSIACYYFHRM